MFFCKVWLHKAIGAPGTNPRRTIRRTSGFVPAGTNPLLHRTCPSNASSTGIAITRRNCEHSPPYGLHRRDENGRPDTGLAANRHGHSTADELPHRLRPQVRKTDKGLPQSDPGARETPLPTGTRPTRVGTRNDRNPHRHGDRRRNERTDEGRTGDHGARPCHTDEAPRGRKTSQRQPL